MNTKKRILTLGIALVTVFTLVGIASAQGMGAGRGAGKGIYGQQGPKGQMGPGRGMRGPRRGNNSPGIMGELRGLNLTEGQRQQIRSIMEVNRPSESERAEHQEIMKAMRNGTATEQQKERAKEIAALRIDREAGIRQQVRGILTAEQQGTLDKRQQLKEQKMQKMRERRQNRSKRGN